MTTMPIRLSKPNTDLALLPDQANPTRVGLGLPPGLTYEQWLEYGDKLSLIEQSVRWWWGDWLNYQEGEYGSKYVEALSKSDLSYQSLMDAKWVAGAFEISRRRENLSWSHHQEVAGLELDEQDRLLDEAAEHGWSQKKLRAVIKGPKPLPEPIEESAVEVLPLERYMIGATPAQVITSIVRTLFPSAKTVLDPTYGNGNFHDGTLGLTVTAHDKLPERAPDGPMDVTELDYNDASVDIVLFDGPHLADLGEDSIFGERFGTMTQEDIDNLIIDGTRECWRVCRIAIVVKITDSVHGGVFQEESALVGEALNWPTPYEKVHQVREKGVVDPRWEAEHDRYSAYNNGSTYLVFKKGSQIHGTN
jgi:hypothetical protein